MTLKTSPKRRAQIKQYKIDHPKWYKDVQRRSRKRRSVRMAKHIRAIKDRPCADCGNRYPYYVMDFDHIRGDKKFSMGNIPRLITMATRKIEDEIAKCDVVCANCHRIRTHSRRSEHGGI